MSDTLALAGRLQKLDDDGLAALILTRRLDIKNVKDFFDLADRLLETAAIERALTALPRDTLVAISAVAAASPRRPGAPAEESSPTDAAADDAGNAVPDDGASAPLPAALATAEDLMLGLNSASGFRLFDPVIELISQWPTAGHPSATELAETTAPTASIRTAQQDIDDDRLAAERAFTATTATAELIHELRVAPARELAKGGLSAPDTKRLVGALGVDQDALPAIVHIADRAGLVALSGNQWIATPAALPWLLRPSAERWSVLAAAWLDSLPGDIGPVLTERSDQHWGQDVLDYLAWYFPLGGDALTERIATVLAAAESLGISANGSPGLAARALLGTERKQITDVAAELLPEEGRQVYLQHDLSVIAPGPLAPDIDIRLRKVSDIEGRGLASTYRISAASINRALLAGETAETLTQFFTEISLTGVPQPVAYLLNEASVRHGVLRAGRIDPPEESGALSYVRSDDVGLISTIAVDQGLAILGLVRSGPHRLVSRYPFETLYWSIADARYPLVAEDANGELFSPVRTRPSAREPEPEVDPVAQLIERLRATGTTADNQGVAWTARQLDTALKAKTAVTVTVAMPNGESLEMTVTPLSIASGRMRATDAKAGTERTLPLGRITAVRTAD